MFGWLKRGGGTPGWLAVSFDAATLDFAQARRIRGAKAQVSSYAARELGEGRLSLDRATRDYGLGGRACSTMLRPGEYDIVQVEAPNVPRAEMKSALRWKVKDLVSYPMDEATIDFLEIPPEEGSAEGRSQQLHAVLARNELLQARVRKFDDAGIALSVIDIPDTAQRNIAALYEEERGVALIYFGRNAGLLTISHRGELYLTRRLELGVEELAGDVEFDDGGPHERVVLEIQRTLDHFERQFRYVAVGKLLLAPTGRETRLREILSERFEMPVQDIDLNDVLSFAERPDEQTQWRLFHHFGAALREPPAT
jgi:MSHA biogenesis protein MshI